MALAAAARTGNGYGTCAALVELRRLDEARTPARRLDEEGRMTALQSASLWLRLNRAVWAAARAARDIGRRGPEPAEPWGLPAIQAELRLQLGDLDTAHDQAQQGVRAYEEHRARLAPGLLALRIGPTPGDPGLYHCALLSPTAPDLLCGCTGRRRVRLGGTQPFGLPRRGARPSTPRRATRGLVPPCARGCQPGHVGRPDTRELAGVPVRRHPQRIARCVPARTTGPAANAPGPAPGTQAKSRLARLAAAGRELDAAEAAVRRLSPAALASHAGSELPEAARIAAALPTDTLLITHHVFDEDLVGWAVTRNAVRAERCRRWAGEVTHSTDAASTRGARSATATARRRRTLTQVATEQLAGRNSTGTGG